MEQPDFSVMDHPAISMRAFYPRPRLTPTPANAEDFLVEAADGVRLSVRLHPAALTAPTILFFYGNGETSGDYDGLAPFYNRAGLNLLVTDYRGYGGSGGQPTFSAMLADARATLRQAKARLRAAGYADRFFVMGRSMGRHAAFELATECAAELQGVIIESGRPSLAQFAQGLPRELAEALETAYRQKVAGIPLPALVIHGERDELAPLEQAEAMYASLPNPQKRLLIIPHAGHNDLFHRGTDEYLAALREFTGAGEAAD